jgi:predicted PurR-regulated permease PerM
VQRWPLALVVLALLSVMFYVLQPILLPFVLGGLLGYLGDPLVDALERRGLGRTAGVLVVFVLFTTLVVVGVLFAFPLVLQQLDALIQKIPVFYQWLTDVLVPWLRDRLSVPAAQLPEIDWSGQLAEHWQSLGRVTASTLKSITGSGAGFLLGLFNLALVPVVAFYLMRDWDILMQKALGIVPVAWRQNVVNLVLEADEVLSAFIRGQFLVMCSLGVIYSTGLWLVGVQFALVLGVIAGLASIVPYLGFVVGILASCVLAYVQYQEFTILLWVALVFGVGQVLESVLLTPVLVGDRIGLHPVAVIFALMAGGQLAGFVGVLLALPVSAVIMVFVRHALAHYRASQLFGGD